jgi:hypothetical protein
MIPRPETETNNLQLLPNQTLIFNNQPKHMAPPKNNLTSKKYSQPVKPHLTFPANQKTAPDPTTIKPRPDKKLKSLDPNFSPVLNPSTQVLTQEDMDAQTEKKSRREDDDDTTTSKNHEENKHFLTAGPGSQDCRDQ